jgi:hypothetical protein
MIAKQKAEEIDNQLKAADRRLAISKRKQKR